MKNREEILKELKEIAPELAKLDKKPMSEVPANYFTAFPADLLKKINANEAASELASVAPFLAKLEKVHSFNAPPQAYFQSLPETILKQVRASENVKNPAKNGWMISLNVYFDRMAAYIFKPKYSMAFAGFATVIILAVMLVMKVENQCTDLDCRMAQISDEELNSYFSSHSDEFSTGLLDMTDEKYNPESGMQNMLSDISDEELNNAILD